MDTAALKMIKLFNIAVHTLYNFSAVMLNL